jgi:dTDP-glucose 4,6-dehydratase/UDP-glucuronate decarboxylase
MDGGGSVARDHDPVSAAAVLAGDLELIAARSAEARAALDGAHVLVTGGAGFLGYELVQALLHFGERPAGGAPAHVTVWDNFARGVPAWLDALAGSPRLTVVRRDVTGALPDDMPEVDFIVHAASIASPTYYRLHPLETMDANVEGVRRLLDLGRRRAEQGRPLRGLLFFSTSEIYGDPTPGNIPTPETYRGHVSCTGPRACYDESKRYGETLCVTFAQKYGVPVAMARPFNNYGPGLKITDGRVIPDFARDILAGRDVVMRSDGSPGRTYCYVADAVAGYLAILTRGRPGEPYNIGVGGPEVTVAELAAAMTELGRELFGYRGAVVVRPSDDGAYLTDNPARRCPVIAKAQTELGYEPSVSLRDGLRRTLLWYAENQDRGEEA